MEKLKEKQEFQIEYHYKEPENEAEVKEQQRILDKVYFKLFDLVWAKMCEEKEQNKQIERSKKII